MNVVDKLIEGILRTQNPSVVGLDPDLGKIPACYKTGVHSEDPFEAVAQVIGAFNRDLIDTVADLVPAVKPQTAFYEQYGSHGVAALEKTVAYARSKGLVVIEDAKRNDIGNTARAYAEGHLGRVELLDGSRVPAMDGDFLTVTPFLGQDSLRPFAELCKERGKGIFVLARTSNPGAGELQDAVTAEGITVTCRIAGYLSEWADASMGKYGYSSIGAVVGATYPAQAAELRKLMPKCFFLVPGYGAQGGGAEDTLPCFNPDGLGAVVNSSRGILYSHMSDGERMECTRREYLAEVKKAVLNMRRNLYTCLRAQYPAMCY